MEKPLTLDNLIIDTFNAFNVTNRSNGLSFYEIRAAVRALCIDISDKRVCDIFNIDRDDRKTTFISFKEFRAPMGALIMSQGNHYFSDLGFDLMVSGDDGLITADDLTRIASKVGRPITKEKAESMIKVLGNEDGQVTYEVFCELMSFDGTK